MNSQISINNNYMYYILKFGINVSTFLMSDHYNYYQMNKLDLLM